MIDLGCLLVTQFGPIFVISTIIKMSIVVISLSIVISLFVIGLIAAIIAKRIAVSSIDVCLPLLIMSIG